MGGLPLIFKNKTDLQDEKENVTQNTLNTCLLETREKNGLYCSCFFCAEIIGCWVHETIEIQEPDRNQTLKK